jgi:uncharacterized iron-regulated membrane protein
MTMRPDLPLRTPVRARLRDLLRKLHLWLGLSIGLLFAALALAGTVLTYQTELLRWQHPEWAGYALPTPEQRAAVLQQVYEARWPAPLRSIELPSAELRVWQLYLAGDTRIYLHPTDGHPLLSRAPSDDAVLWLRYLHTHLLSGRAGEQWLGVLGMLELALLLIGLVLWWPRRGQWRHAVRVHIQPPVLRWRSWHLSAGAVSFPLLLLITLTGVALIYKDGTRSALGALFGDARPAAKLPLLAPRDVPLRWADSLAAAQAALPQAELRRISLPGPQNGVLVARMRGPDEWNAAGRSMVAVDPYRATVLAVQDAQAQGRGSRLSDAIYPLHAGAVGGRGWRFAIACIGVLPAFFLGTGFLFWRTRTRRRKAAHRRPA